METRASLTPLRKLLIIHFKEVSALHPQTYGRLGSTKWRENLSTYFREVHEQRIVKPSVISNWIEKNPWILEPPENSVVTKSQAKPDIDFDPPQPIDITTNGKSDSLTDRKITASAFQPERIPKYKAADPVNIYQDSHTNSAEKKMASNVTRTGLGQYCNVTPPAATSRSAPPGVSRVAPPGVSRVAPPGVSRSAHAGASSPAFTATFVPSVIGGSDAGNVRPTAVPLEDARPRSAVNSVEAGRPSLDNVQSKADTTPKQLVQSCGYAHNSTFLNQLDVMDTIAEKLNRSNTTMTPASTSRAAALVDSWVSFVDTLQIPGTGSNLSHSSVPSCSSSLVDGRLDNDGETRGNENDSFEDLDTTLPLDSKMDEDNNDAQGQENGVEHPEQENPNIQPNLPEPAGDAHEPKIPPILNNSIPNIGSENSNFGPSRNQHHHHNRHRDHHSVSGFPASHPNRNKFMEIYDSVYFLAGNCDRSIGRSLSPGHRHLDRFLQVVMRDHRHFLIRRVTGRNPRLHPNIQVSSNTSFIEEVDISD